MTTAVTSGGAAARLAAMGDAVRQALMDATMVLAAQLEDTVNDALTGGLLQPRSGALRDSIFAEVGATGGTVQLRLGSELPYAGFQERGFSGSEQVREHLRRQSVAFGRPMTPRDVLVRTYSRQVDYAGRAFLSGPLTAMADDIVATYRDTVRGALGR